MSDDQPGDMDPCRLYLITPSVLDPNLFGDHLAAVLDAAEIAAVQLRLKDASDTEWRRAIDSLRPIAQSRNVAFLLNDRADLVIASGADGVHVGQQDMPAAKARALIGPDRMLGVTCHDSRDLAMRAGEDGADYVAFGAFYSSLTKQAPHRAAPDLLTWWSDIMEVPCVAIGGITAENCAPLVEAGADFLAVCGSVWAHPQGPVKAVQALAQAMLNGPVYGCHTDQ